MDIVKKTSPPIIVILGPTASGKSALAVRIAKKIGGEVISADSRQVYKDMDIGTAKVTRDRSNRDRMRTNKRRIFDKHSSKFAYYSSDIRHHLLDVANPKRSFTVAQYKKLAEKAIREIIKRGRIPIVCGGTGLYIQALVDDVQIPNIPPNKKLRESLSKKSMSELFAILKKKDPRRAASIDPQNPRRLIRALEIVEAIGKVPRFKTSPKKNVLFIGIKVPMEKLKSNIERRLKKRIHAGMLREIKTLHASGVSWRRLHDLGLEYRYGAPFLQKKISRREFEDQLLRASVKYAKRQMTWFKKDKRIHWIKNSSEAVTLARQRRKNPAIYGRV